MPTLRQHLLTATMDFLRGGSLVVWDGHSGRLAELPILSMAPTRDEDLEVKLLGPIVQSGYAARATLHTADGLEVRNLTVGPEGADIAFDSQTFVQGDRVALTLWGI